MQLSKADLDSFKKIYLERFGIELTDAEAYEKGLKVVQMVKAVYEPMKRDNG